MVKQSGKQECKRKKLKLDLSLAVSTIPHGTYMNLSQANVHEFKSRGDKKIEDRQEKLNP